MTGYLLACSHAHLPDSETRCIHFLFCSAPSTLQVVSAQGNGTTTDPASGDQNATGCTGSSITRFTRSTGFGNQTFVMALHLEVNAFGACLFYWKISIRCIRAQSCLDLKSPLLHVFNGAVC